MKNVTWNDNLCTVGWTTVHGEFAARDMDWLLSMQPKGYFTPTFYTRGNELSQKEHLSWQEYMWTKPGESRRFYYSFPEDEKGVVLLTALRLQGMKGRGCHER